MVKGTKIKKNMEGGGDLGVRRGGVTCGDEGKMVGGGDEKVAAVGFGVVGVIRGEGGWRREEGMSRGRGIEINTTNATTFSTPTVASETGENTIHNLGLRYTPGGSEEWNRMVENGFKLALGVNVCKAGGGNRVLQFICCGLWFHTKKFCDVFNDLKELIGYAIDTFYEGHNHRLCSLKEREFRKNVRTLNLYMKQTIVNNCILNIGATKTFRIMAEQSNGYANIGASLTEFKNFKRNIKCYIGDKDADMILDYLNALSESQDGFYYAYQVDEDNCLAKIFWADAQARMNYSLFGDTITFDPTYDTNKYHKAFTPFTGVDNHKKSVTFDAALVDHENDGSFIWVFKKCLDCMGNKEPQCILTDQDPAFKLGVRSVFKKARHRYCMWHIMKKLTDKVKSQICKETDFVERICGVVWDTDLEPIEFEEKWTQSAMEQQRYNHRFLDAASDSTLPQVSSKTMIEKHASKIYTHTVFYEFQEQVQMAPCSCAVRRFSEQGNMHIINVEDAYGKHRIFQEKDCKAYRSKDIETRWTKKSYRKPLYGLDGKLLQDYDPTYLRKLELSRVWLEFYATISVLNSMPENQIKELSLMLLQFREKINPTKESLTKDQELEMLLGCSAKSNITVLPPKIAKNKGSGKRMKSNKDKAIEKASKPKRLCNNCKQMGHHD
ncbi:protein FAR-RED IMPAIRED RESPONSE 1-like [Silene latifolia]|uniref:protein FAR-RED IMPAIRED RESPONSE 1-like n=1 Tax=Silene latifolia TaxID=37657 RepID=UPI003D776D26